MGFRKCLWILTALLLLLGLAACGPETPDSTASSAGSTASAPASSVPSTVTTAPSVSTAPTEPPATQPTVPEVPVEATEQIGLAHLRSQPKADAMVAFYDQVAAACQALQQQELPVEGLNLEEVTMVLNHYRQDHPESFWYSSQFEYRTLGNKLLSVTLLYEEYDLGTVQFGQDAVNSAVEAMLELLSEDMSDYDKALTLYDALIDHCDYVTDAPNAHNIFGALVDGEAVCEGYALAYQYLLMRAGIPAMYVTGFSREDHAWNAMQLDGQWYYADPTWDDPKGNDGTFRYYGYFGLSWNMMCWDHEAYEDTIPLPEADSMDCNYYHRMGHIVEEFDREQVMQWMLEGDTLRIFVQEWPKEYLQTLLANINRMVIEAELPWYGYTYTINGREIIVRFH